MLWGNEDPLFPVRQAREAGQAFSAASVVLSGAGHWPHSEAHDAFNVSLLTFLDRVERSASNTEI